ncbi:MAG: hypothetical protein K6T78_10220 [Alicyclobacillus sp.]|nr:hypothetical protein [Alicyclobacillus sp.]
MKVVTVPRDWLNPIPLPGMGRSIELPETPQAELSEIRIAFSRGELFVSFEGTAEAPLRVKQMWANPHSPQVTLFV